MRYAKKRDSEIDWQLDDDRAQERQVRLRRREGQLAPKLTRKMAKIDARLLAMSRADYQDPIATLRPPTSAIAEEATLPFKRAVRPPPLPIPFPFPFVNGAGSGEMPIVTVTSSSDECVVDVHDSWLLPPADGAARVSLRSLRPSGVGSYPIPMRSLVPREPEPFSVVPPRLSLPPRS